MSPRVFISSTIRDLAHVRHAVRDTVIELGYSPVMSDYGEIGYLPDQTAADSCYKEALHCDLGILIVSKRYGENHRNGVSVTHGELRTLHENKAPIITLVEKDILTFKHLRDSNLAQPIQFPGMDRPDDTFALIEEIGRYPRNNGIHEFTKLGEVGQIVRQQFAHFFGDLIRNRFDPVRGEIKDILASIAALREQLNLNQERQASTQFLLISRALLEDEACNLKNLLVALFATFDNAVSMMLKHGTFDSLMSEGAGLSIEITKDAINLVDAMTKSSGGSHGRLWNETFGSRLDMGYHVVNSKLYLTAPTVESFRSKYLAIKANAPD